VAPVALAARAALDNAPQSVAGSFF